MNSGLNKNESKTKEKLLKAERTKNRIIVMETVKTAQNASETWNESCCRISIQDLPGKLRPA